MGARRVSVNQNLSVRCKTKSEPKGSSLYDGLPQGPGSLLNRRCRAGSLQHNAVPLPAAACRTVALVGTHSFAIRKCVAPDDRSGRQGRDRTQMGGERSKARA